MVWRRGSAKDLANRDFWKRSCFGLGGRCCCSCHLCTAEMLEKGVAKTQRHFFAVGGGEAAAAMATALTKTMIS